MATTPQTSGTPQTLDAMAHQARMALACAFTSSDDYESQLIAVRRARGDYRQRADWTNIAAIAVGVVVLLALIALI